MNGDIYSNMPDTSSRTAPYRRSIRRLIASTLIFTSSLLLVTSMGLAQDSGDDSDGNGNFAPQSVNDDNGDLENRGEFADEVEDDSSNDAEDDSNASASKAQQTPDTGGVALLPLAGSALTAGFGGFMLLRRR